MAIIPAMAQTERSYELVEEIRPPFSIGEPPRWAGGMMVGRELYHGTYPLVYTMDRSGRREDFLFTLPDGASVAVWDWAIAANGEIALVGTAYVGKGPASGFVARIAPDHKSQVVTRTLRYLPRVVSFGPRGTIWTIGQLNSDDGKKVIAESQLGIFNGLGKILVSKKVRVEGSRPVEQSYLRASHDRVGWFTKGGEYIEFSRDGQEMMRIQAPSEVSGFGLSLDNEAVAGNFLKREEEFLVLDRSTNTWEPVVVGDEEDSPPHAWVLGFDGDGLIVTDHPLSILRFRMN